MIFFLLLLSIIATPAYGQQPNFTTGTMTQTVTASQTVNETVVSTRVGSALTVWNGDNVRPEVNGNLSTIQASGVDFAVVDPSHPWQLEIQTRQAGVVETINTTRVIQTDTVTNTLSVFAQ